MSNRANARAGCKALLDAYVAAYTDASQPTFLGEVLDHPPQRVTGRCAWVNKVVGETFGFGANVQQRVLQPSITVVTKITSTEEYTDEQDAIVDALVALVTTAAVQTTI